MPTERTTRASCRQLSRLDRESTLPCFALLCFGESTRRLKKRGGTESSLPMSRATLFLLFADLSALPCCTLAPPLLTYNTKALKRTSALNAQNALPCVGGGLVLARLSRREVGAHSARLSLHRSRAKLPLLSWYCQRLAKVSSLDSSLRPCTSLWLSSRGPDDVDAMDRFLDVTNSFGNIWARIFFFLLKK